MKWILLLIVVAGVAGYFTRPEEAVMRERADAVLSDPQNVTQGFESLGATIAGERAYSNYYVLAEVRRIARWPACGRLLGRVHASAMQPRAGHAHGRLTIADSTAPDRYRRRRVFHCAGARSARSSARARSLEAETQV